MTQSSDIRTNVARPIIFSAPMVRALLDGRKTQTRRLAKFVQPDGDGWHIRGAGGGMIGADDDAVLTNAADYAPYAVGDRLYVREAWARTFNVNAEADWPGRPHRAIGDSDLGECAIYRADGPWQWCDDDGFSTERGHWKPSIHMPRWASRLTLLVDDVRVQRLRDITNEDCIAEGIPVHPNEHAPRTGPTADAFDRKVGLITHYGWEFKRLWESLHGKGSWMEDPWVVAVTFRVELGNIDQIERQAA